MEITKPKSVEEYISNCEEPGMSLMKDIRSFLQGVIPHATEVISYGMPAFKTSEVLLYYAVNKGHIGIYPTGKGIEAFANKLESMGLKFSKGAIQIPFTIEIPFELLKEIAIFRNEQVGIKSPKKKK